MGNGIWFGGAKSGKNNLPVRRKAGANEIAFRPIDLGDQKKHRTITGNVFLPIEMYHR